MYIATKGFSSMMYLNSREKKQRNVKNYVIMIFEEKNRRFSNTYIFSLAVCMQVSWND